MEESIAMVETRIAQVEDRLVQFKKQEAARKATEKYEDPAIVGNIRCSLKI
jgi:phage shock protein A